MRLLVVGDTHGDLEWVLDDVIPMARKHDCDRIMQLGDFGFVWDDMSATALRRLSHLMTAAELPLHFLPGNHENHPMLDQLTAMASRDPWGHIEIAPNIFYTGRVHAWQWAGQRIAAVGGATSIDWKLRTPGVSWWPEEALTDEEEQQAIALGPVDLLFTHDSPIRQPFGFLVPDQDSQAHRERIDRIATALRPRRWFHGHYHQHATYRFLHPDGACIVVALDCNRAPRLQAMAVLDLPEPPGTVASAEAP